MFQDGEAGTELSHSAQLEEALDQSPKLTLAIVGNPNSGKTTLFNALTGSRYKVANYPGVTVEKKEGTFSLDESTRALLVDTPGVYSLSGLSLDEQITTNLVLGNIKSETRPAAVIAVVDATNLERNLYLVSQLLDTGLPVVVALTMIDLAEKRGLQIRRELLSRVIGVPVVAVQAKKGSGLDDLKAAVLKLSARRDQPRLELRWCPSEHPVREAIEALAGEIAGNRDAHGPPARAEQAAGRGPVVAAASPSRDPRYDEFLALAYIFDLIPPPPRFHAATEGQRAELTRKNLDWQTLEATARYRWIRQVIERSVAQEHVDSISSRLDALLTHRVWGALALAVILFSIFQAIFIFAQLPMDLIEVWISWCASLVGDSLPEGMLRSLIVDGIIGGVGNVIVFVPQIAILTFLLGLLEDSGYLSRAAFIMDRVMRPFGLQGRSFVPMLSSFACAIPGILSTRTIPAWSDRIITIMVLPLMSCSARLPVYTVLIAAFVPNQWIWGVFSLQGLALFALYLLGIIAAGMVSWTLRMSVFKGRPALFLMEMPPFRIPSLRVIVRECYDRVGAFLKNAGTLILACSIVLWFLASYPSPAGDAPTSSRVKTSFAGQLGQAIEPLIKPLGFNWEIGVSIIASFAAREVFVSSLSTIYNVAAEDDSEHSTSLVNSLKQRRAEGTFTTATAFSLLVFYVFASQCMSTLAVCRRETGSWGWVAFMFLYMTALAVTASFVTYRLSLGLGFGT